MELPDEVMKCAGRIRVCAHCSRKFWNIKTLVYRDLDRDNVFCCEGATIGEQMNCVLEWGRRRPGSLLTVVKRYLFTVERYIPNSVYLENLANARKT